MPNYENKFIDMIENPSEATRKYIEQHNARVLARQIEKEARKKARAEMAAKAAAIVQKGDVFEMSWGYDQTNQDFFQVVEKVGAKSVRIRQVSPPILSDSPDGPMSTTRTYEMPKNGEMLPPVRSSVFIEDQVNGDVKRISATDFSGSIRPVIKMRSYAYAYKVETPTIKCYESWYH